MGTIRTFNGSRESAKNPVVDLVKLEIQKKGKLPQAERYRYILKKRMEMAGNLYGMELKAKTGVLSDFKTMMNKKINDSKNKRMGEAANRAHSKRAQQAMKEIAMKKAAKEAKAMRQRVIVQPRNFHNGSINKKGRIYDIASNQVGQVNLKNGKITTLTGWSLGKYKRGFQTNMIIQEAINTHSPYFINMRKMQQMQQGNAWGVTPQDTVNLYGATTPPSSQPMEYSDYYGSNLQGPRQNIGVTSWGAQSNNVWGTFADNAWGTVSDNAWGTASTDVWGGISVGGLWGVKGTKIWGTGNGRNYLAKLTAAVAAFFGLKTKGGRAARQAFMAQRLAGGGGSRSRGTTQRTSATTRR